MKPIQQHKDPRITNISLDNFTGSISIITPSSDDDTKELMLSSPQTNGNDHFIPNHHLALITQPVLGARSRLRKKDKINSRRTSFNDSPLVIFPINSIEKSSYEKKTHSNNHHESSDSGLDLSLSTNSSVQYPQQHIVIHRPLSALNEDSISDDTERFPSISLGRNHSMEKMINDNTRSSSLSDERLQEQIIKRSSDGSLSNMSTELQRQTNINKNEFLCPPTQQYRSSHDLMNKNLNKVQPIHNETLNNNLSSAHTSIRNPNTSTLKPLRKKTKFQIVIEPSISSHHNVDDEQIYPLITTTNGLSNQTTPRFIQQMKPKAITPLGHHPNPEQIRAHINRSVIERQYPPSLPIPSRKGLIQQIIPFDASPSKFNNLLLRQHGQHHQPTTAFHTNSNIPGGGFGSPTSQHLQITPTRSSKQTLPMLYNEETIENRREDRRKQIKIEKLKEQDEKKRSNEINREQIRTKVQDFQQHSKSNQKPENSHHFVKNQDADENHIQQINSFLTSTPRRHRRQQQIVNRNTIDSRYEHLQLNNLNRRQHRTNLFPPDSSILSYSDEKPRSQKPTEFVIRNKNQIFDQNTQFDSEYSHQNTLVSSQSRPSKIYYQTSTKLHRDPIIQSQTKQKTEIGSMNSLLQTTRIQPINSNTRREREGNQSNILFQARSPISWLDQQTFDPYASSSPRDKLNKTYRLIITDEEQQPLDGRYVIPNNNSSPNDPHSQTSSRHTYPFNCTPDFDHSDNSSRRKQSIDYKLTAPNSVQNTIDHHSSLSSVERSSSNENFNLSSGRAAVSLVEDDISTNYDSDDGWSNDSAELLYVDERYVTHKKKINTTSSSSSSHLILLQHQP